MKKKNFLSHVFFRAAVVVAALFTPISSMKAEGQAVPEHKKFSLVSETVSIHMRDIDQMNWKNPGLGGELRLSDHFHVGAGVYRNSNYGTSAYAVTGAELRGNRTLGAGVETGVVVGYDFGYWEIAGTKVMPAVLPYLRFGSREKFNIKLNIMPPSKFSPLIFAPQLRFPLK